MRVCVCVWTFFDSTSGRKIITLDHHPVKPSKPNKQVDDLATVFELGEEVFTSELPNLYQIWSEAEVIDLFGSDAENCFVAESEGNVVGFCLGTTIEKKHSSCTSFCLCCMCGSVHRTLSMDGFTDGL